MLYPSYITLGVPSDFRDSSNPVLRRWLYQDEQHLRDCLAEAQRQKTMLEQTGGEFNTIGNWGRVIEWCNRALDTMPARANLTLADIETGYFETARILLSWLRTYAGFETDTRVSVMHSPLSIREFATVRGGPDDGKCLLVDAIKGHPLFNFNPEGEGVVPNTMLPEVARHLAEKYDAMYRPDANGDPYWWRWRARMTDDMGIEREVGWLGHTNLGMGGFNGGAGPARDVLGTHPEFARVGYGYFGDKEFRGFVTKIPDLGAVWHDFAAPDIMVAPKSFGHECLGHGLGALVHAGDVTGFNFVNDRGVPVRDWTDIVDYVKTGNDFPSLGWFVPGQIAEIEGCFGGLIVQNVGVPPAVTLTANGGAATPTVQRNPLPYKWQLYWYLDGTLIGKAASLSSVTFPRSGRARCELRAYVGIHGYTDGVVLGSAEVDVVVAVPVPEPTPEPTKPPRKRRKRRKWWFY